MPISKQHSILAVAIYLLIITKVKFVTAVKFLIAECQNDQNQQLQNLLQVTEFYYTKDKN